MTRALHWIAVFVLAALVAHLAYALFAPRLAAGALMRDLRRQLGVNAFHALSGPLLRRLVRHPARQTAYGACLLDLSRAPVRLAGAQPRTLWTLTVYSPRGDVIYAITDRHLPPGELRVRFEYRELDTAGGEIALPKLKGRAMIVPLQVKSALLLMEAHAWHPGLEPLVREQVAALKCERLPEAPPPAAAPARKGVSRTFIVPRPRPVRAR